MFNLEAFASFHIDTNSSPSKWAVLVETWAFGLWLEQRNLSRILD